MKKIFLSMALLSASVGFGQYTSQVGLRIMDATSTTPSPGIKYWGSSDTDGFIHSTKFINNYGFGFYNKTNGDTYNNGMNTYLSGFFGLDFFTERQSRVRISRDGKFGIGTQTPTERLDVNGNVKISNGDLLIANSTFTPDQGGSIRLVPNSSTSTPYLDFARFGNPNFARFIYSNNGLSLQNAKLNLDNQGLEFLHSTWGNGYGARIIGSDNGNGSTSMRFQVRKNNASFSDALRIQTDGKISIGNSSLIPNSIAGTADVSNYRLFVEGGILSEEVRVALKSTWADYVFAPSYQLKTIDEVASFIKENGHLPNVPSAKQVEAEGINVAEMATIQMEKIEELTLYIIELKKEIDALKAKK